MQITIARQLGLDSSTVSNFFMNARRRSIDKWREDAPNQTISLTSGGINRTIFVTSSGTPATVLTGTPATILQQLSQSDLSPSIAGQLDLWQGDGVGASTASHTVYIIPRDRLVAAGGTLTLSTPSGTHHLTIDEDELLDGDVMDDDDDEILETEEVLDDDDCLDRSPD